MKVLWKFITNNTVILYLLVGSVLFLIDLGVFLTLTKVFGLQIAIAQGISRTVGATVGFGSHKLVTFHNRSKKVKTVAAQGTGYVVLTVANIFISAAVVSGIEYIISHNLVLVKILAEIIMVTETYFVLRVIFAKPSNTEKKDPIDDHRD